LFSENKNNLEKYDLIHYPYFDLFYHTLPLKNVTKTVVTVPDVTPLLYPKYYPPGVRGKLNFYLQKLALKSVDAVITLTETSKKDIIRLLEYPGEKVFSIHLAPNFKSTKISAQKLQETRKKFNLSNEFVLYIGDVNWNKNLIRLIKAVKKINKTLLIVGKNAVRTDYDKKHIENAPLREIQEKYGDDKQIKRLGFVDDSELNAIWQLASIYCMPSLYEGFGLSVVEAMEAGVPVVCSNTPTLKEVAGEAAVYFDPYSVEDIAKKISSLLKNKTLQRELIRKGRNQAKNYSWEKTTKQTLTVYQKVLRSSRLSL